MTTNANTTATAHIHATFNNTIVTISINGDVKSQSSGGACGFHNAKSSTPHAAKLAADKASLKALEKCTIKAVVIEVKGPGPGRESAMRAVAAHFKEVIRITDATKVPHNGCRASGERSV